jgi:hypothetical protein
VLGTWIKGALPGEGVLVLSNVCEDDKLVSVPFIKFPFGNLLIINKLGEFKEFIDNELVLFLYDEDISFVVFDDINSKGIKNVSFFDDGEPIPPTLTDVNTQVCPFNDTTESFNTLSVLTYGFGGFGFIGCGCSLLQENKPTNKLQILHNS